MHKSEIIYKPGITIDRVAGDGGYEWNQAWGPECIYRDVLPILQPGDSVLDLGCGTGRCSIALGFHGAEVTGVDNDQEILDACSERYEGAGLSVALIKGDYTQMNLTSLGRYKAIVAVDSFNHLSKSEALKIIEVLPDILTDEGILVVSFPSTLSWSYGRMRDYRRRVEPYTYEDLCDCSGELKMENYAFFEPGEVESMLLRSGMRIICAEATWAPQRNLNWTVSARKNANIRTRTLKWL